MSDNATPSVVYIHDVAREAGCSISTVSKVLNGSGSISPETRQRIVEVANRLGYVPQAAARMLKIRRTETVGLIFHDGPQHLFSNPFYSIVVAGAEEVLTGAGYNLLLGGGAAREASWEFPKFLRERLVDGLILVGDIHPAVLQKLEGARVPLVLIDHESREAETDCIETDGFQGARDAVRYLLACGHREIGMMTATAENPPLAARREGYEAALREAGLRLRPEWILRTVHSEAGGLAAADQLAALPQRPTALFAVNDAMAIGAMRRFPDLGIRVPADISLIGFDDINISEILPPGLTTMRVDMQAMGRQGASVLLDKLRQPAGTRRPPVRQFLPVSLVERGTVARRG